MVPKSALISVAVLRFLTLSLLVGSIVVMVTNTFVSDGTKTSFKNIHGYRYVVSTAIIGFVYTLVQIPFAVYYASKEKRLIKHECLPEFDFYGDKIIAFLLATGVGAGFAISFEFKRLLKDFINALAALGATGLDEEKSSTEKFLDRANIATGLLFFAFLCMAILSVLSSIYRTNGSSRGGFFR